MFFYKYVLNGIEIAIAIDVIGLKVTCLRPFIPRVDGDEWVEVGSRVEVCLGPTKGLFEPLRGVLSRDGALLRSRTIVPTDTHVRVVGNGELLLQILPFLIGFL